MQDVCVELEVMDTFRRFFVHNFEFGVVSATDVECSLRR
jgi:hypothetical protein